MTFSEITRNRANPPTYSLSANLSIFPIAPKVVKEQSSEFTSALLHEIRNPLTNIDLAMETLKLMITEDVQRMYLDIIKRGSGKINDLVSDLLVPSRMNDMRPEEYSIHQLLDEVLAMTSDRLLLKNITVTKSYDSQDCKEVMDRQNMKIALTNIIINAIDAMPSEGGRLNLVTEYKNGKCVVEIKDNGIGISEKNLKTIFEPYFTNKPGGMGLGLSTTLDILLSNHVTVDVTSKEGEGTQFVLLFDCPKK